MAAYLKQEHGYDAGAEDTFIDENLHIVNHPAMDELRMDDCSFTLGCGDGATVHVHACEVDKWEKGESE